MKLTRTEQTIVEYFYVDELIKKEEESILYPHKEPDENVGGGRGTPANTAEVRAVALLDSKRIAHLEQTEKLVGACYESIDEQAQQVIEHFYLVDGKNRRTEQEVLADFIKSGYDITRIEVREIKENFDNLVAKKFGYI